MEPTLSKLRCLSTFLLLATGILALVGCEPPEEIRTVRATRTPYRLLVAYVPTVAPAGGAWTFRLHGTESDMAAEEGRFAEFMKGVRFQGENPVWGKLPQDWSEEAPADAVTLYAFRVGKHGRMIMRISKIERFDEGSNVDRWRSQLGPGALPEDPDELIKRIFVGGRPGWLFDGLGPGSERVTKP